MGDDKTMNLQKRECPISFRFVPYGSGWEDIYLTVNGNEHYFVVTGVFGPTNVDDLFEAVVGFHPTYNSCGYLHHQYVDETMDGIPTGATVSLPGEGFESEWTFKRPPVKDANVPIAISIVKMEEGEELDSPITFTVGYKDLCYAVAKGMTEAMKNHGLFGYVNAVWGHDLNLRVLLMLKAFALGAEDVLKVEDLGRGNGERTDFAKELELLLFDM